MNTESTKFREFLEETRYCGLGTTPCLLAKVWRATLADINPPYIRFDMLLDHYIDICKMPASAARNVKGNLLKAFGEKELTRSIFTTALVITNYDQIELELTCINKEGVEFKEQITLYTYRRVLDEALENGTQPNYKLLDTNGKLLTDSFKKLRRNIVSNHPTFTGFNAFLNKFVLERLDGFTQKEVASFKSRIKGNLGRDNVSWKAMVDGLTILDIEYIKLGVYMERPGIKRFNEVISSTEELTGW